MNWKTKTKSFLKLAFAPIRGNANFFIPASGQCVAALAFDSAGTTKIGKYVLNHSYMLPGLACTIISVVVAMVLGAVLF